MARLTDLLSTREIMANQQNLEKGRVFTVTPSTMYTCIRDDTNWCWTSPGCGVLEIEMWGAAGGGSRMCCCGGGLPGNAPGYTRKCMAVFCNTAICACPGMACNAHDLCFSGCGLPSYLRWCNARDLCGYSNGCMCAQGGRGGTSWCSTGTSVYCCFVAGGFCHTLFGNSCGIVCNQCPGAWIGCGYGGDTNCCGCISYMHFFCNLGNPRPCYVHQFVAYAPGVFSDQGGVIASMAEEDPEFTQWSGTGLLQHQYAQNALSRSPVSGISWVTCYASSQSCGCYEMYGCMPFNSYGVGGLPSYPCPDVRDHGKRGGHGAIRLTYRGSNIYGQNCAKLGGSY